MKGKWSKDNFIYFTSGATNKTMGEFIEKNPDWKLFENDVSAWDASFSEYLCELEVWTAAQFGAPKAVLDLMKANIRTHGVTTNGWRYECRGTRKSGDPFTSCFNSLFNAMMHLFVFHIQTGVEIDYLKDFIRMMVMGDDNLMRHQGQIVNFYDDFLQLGFETECIYRDNLWETEFCSSIPIMSKQGLVFVPKPGKMISKFGYFVQPPETTPKELLYGNYCGMLFLSFIPWFDSLLKGVLKHTGRVEPRKINFKNRHELGEHKYKYVRVDWCPETNYFIQMRYGFDNYMFEQTSVALQQNNMQHVFVQAMFDRETDGLKSIYTH